MSTINDASCVNLPEQSALGKSTAYISQYDPGLLFPIPRSGKRAEIGLTTTLPFFGVDIWNAYEVSWLNLRGKPQIAIATITVPAESPNIVESKSFKLYLNSFNQTRLADAAALVALVQTDLSAAAGASVHVSLTLPDEFARLSMQELSGTSLDRLDIEVDHYTPEPSLLRAAHDHVAVTETLVSHLLKSNCLVTGQPDWGSVQISYVGAPIDQERLLKYLIGFRDHNEFHEQCVERIFVDIMRHCQPQKLSVYARYTRRGGLDINPWRSNFSTSQKPGNGRNARQ
ncbi:MULTISPECIES: NADPH-dependent 7-cyano-7-deazaguanine reductase QueF [unclassified Undibacterium]|uniref:NADPH-dependent 7-cyano-7-deazaguanine reductase QueF n=1 Tax=unclassified Undibacterium TaxID=2630295 RepID=UPI002AC8A44A|nr:MULTISPECIES: NADPH-dependent 7-cyano-7-deazaguanine reductase QueF [unclassified Undibacterium]MEB0140707.1 NADPH-dependent 7-cyano-7-deazaguanine reductase QueF [Undibacterium sp. CCC2.1]MEB0172324.1 NADPH-dependent 7-cyano-7-deazaguanine reductase QueF [Undibacterium sp. CCC1.1]MEB0176240.1 NADPH-dependent 7-cyano-7-deazaguanine reductase QueF [Undibacterium sp. CCC3.4]MEB0215520.1 NADPH-dependent 7-cyano-7-deazaguanine reductase QueF [Undibacterium sp. 5I2]WPX44334.1 NADPH-dependent 7-c